MQHLDICPKTIPSLIYADAVRARVRFLAYHRIKPHVPPLVRAPVNSFEFQPCGRTPQVDNLSLSLSHRSVYRRRLVIIVYSVDYQGI